MATNTTYLELNKVTGSDLVNPLVDTNPNWDKIDAGYHALDIRAIGSATELVSQGVHALTRLDEYAKTFKFVATANYTAGETFTVDGVQVNAYTPSGSALASNAYVTGAVVIASLNADDSVLTIYVSGAQTADNALKLGGELPAYYAKQSDMTSAESDITNLQNQAGNTSIVGIGDGTLSGAISFLNQLIGGGLMPALDFTNPLHTFSTGNLTFTATKDCYLCGTTPATSALNSVAINGTIIVTGSWSSPAYSKQYITPLKLTSGDIVTVNVAMDEMHVFDVK